MPDKFVKMSDVKLIDDAIGSIFTIYIDTNFSGFEYFSVKTDLYCNHYSGYVKGLHDKIDVHIDDFKTKLFNAFVSFLGIRININSITYGSFDGSSEFSDLHKLSITVTSFCETFECITSCRLRETYRNSITSYYGNEHSRTLCAATDHFSELIPNFNKASVELKKKFHDTCMEKYIESYMSDWCEKNHDLLKAARIETLLLRALKDRVLTPERVKEITDLGVVNGVLDSNYVHKFLVQV